MERSPGILLKSYDARISPVVLSRETLKLTSPNKKRPPAINSVAPPPPLTRTCTNRRIRALTRSLFSVFPTSTFTDLKNKLRYMACLDEAANLVSNSEA